MQKRPARRKLEKIQFKGHYAKVKEIREKEVFLLKLPGQKKLENISTLRRADLVDYDINKISPFLRSEAKRLNIPLSEYMKNVTLIHTHRYSKLHSNPEMWYSDATPSEMDSVFPIREMLKRNIRKGMTIIVDSQTGKPMGYTFARLNLNPVFFKRLFGITIEEFNSKIENYKKDRQKKKITKEQEKKYLDKLDEELEKRLESILIKISEIQEKNGTFKSWEHVNLIIAKHLGYNIRFLPEKGYYFDKDTKWFKEKEI